MTSKKKPPIKGADPGAFNVNWEVQAEQLKYSVKKEVEEANLIEEALKSLQRSFKAEEEKRKQAEYQRDLLQKQIQELESNARELKELIRTTRRERKSLAGASSAHDSNSDSDSDNEQGNGVYDYDSHSVDQIIRTSRVVAVQDLEEDFDALLDELRGGHSEGQSSYMSMGQRLKILRGFTTVGKPVQRQEQSQQRYLDKHKQLMKQWIKRENAVHIVTFDEVSRFTFDAHHRKVREAALIDFLRTEDAFLAQIQQVIELIKAFLNSRAFTMDDIQLIFDNSASLFEKQSQLKSFAAAALKETHDLCALGRYLRATAETYQEFLEARKQSREYLTSQRAQFRLKFNTVRTNENSINDLLDSFIPYITRYPSFIAGLFSHVNEHEYEAFGMALPHLCKAFHETNTPFDLPAIPSKAQMYAIQASFDWQNKDGTFIAHNRDLLLNIPLYRRKKDLSRELVGLLLFSDVVVITREHSGKQIFNTFIPLNNLLVWDVPSKAVENPEYPIELVDVQNKKKTVLLCASEKQQSDILSAFITATLAAVE